MPPVQLARIDYIYDNQEDKLYLTEINTIPGSMAFYLWEAAGLSFQEQITRSIEQAAKDNEFRKSLKLEYESDIVEKFVSSKGQ
jgi:D-alanine-D-alanine ligase